MTTLGTTHTAGKGESSTAFGYGCGTMMAVGASVSFVAARGGVLEGLAPDDMIAARSLVAGLVLLPFLLRWGLPSLAGIGWPRGLALLVTGGPLFAILQTGGYAFAPLAHGAVIAPSVVTILSTIGAGLLLSERVTQSHLVGASLVIAGIVVIGWQSVMRGTSGETAWIGDLLFVLSSMLWTGFTLLIRHWRLDAVRATVVVGVLSLAVSLPLYVSYRGWAHVSALPPGALVFQGILQGLVQGVITFMAYGRAVAILGVSRAVLFPALVPAISILIGIPFLGEIPGPAQIAGLLLVSIGMFAAVGRWNRRPTVANTLTMSEKSS